MYYFSGRINYVTSQDSLLDISVLIPIYDSSLKSNKSALFYEQFAWPGHQQLYIAELLSRRRREKYGVLSEACPIFPMFHYSNIPNGAKPLTCILGVIMKQKYSIIKDSENNQLIIREFAELDKKILSLLCEESYENNTIRSAIKTGKEALISTLRTNNLYPVSKYAERIADAVIDLYASKDKESADLLFDDIELLTREPEPDEAAAVIEEESSNVDELLDDDFDDTYEEKSEISKLDSSLKIVDDDYVDGSGQS